MTMFAQDFQIILTFRIFEFRNTLKHIESVSSPSKLSVIARDINFNWASVNTERIQELDSLLSDLEIETDEKKRKNLEAN